MTVFIDASALVAMMSGEPEAAIFEREIQRSHARLTNGIALWETTLAIARYGKSGMDAARAEVDRACRVLNLSTVVIGLEEATEAIRAQSRYGKRTGHPAQLNMGDCFAYACAKTNRATLLYKGNDFVHTDLA